MKVRLVSAAALAVAITAPALAGVITYTDRASFLADAGPLDYTEDFEGFTFDIDYSFITISDPNGFSVGHSGPQDFRNLIDVPPFDFDDGNGTVSISAFVEGDDPNTVTLTPDLSAMAFGTDVSSAAGLEGAVMEVYNGGGLLTSITLTNGIDDFFGFITNGGDEITHILIRAASANGNQGGEGFRMDNFVGVNIPAPGALALLALGAVGIRRKRKRAA